MVFTMVIVVASSFFAVGCDPEGHKQCEWVLEPESQSESVNSDVTKADMFPVCARNRRTMKQDCRLQAPEDFIKKTLGKKFRYVDLKIQSPGNPRTILDITYCE